MPKLSWQWIGEISTPCRVFHALFLLPECRWSVDDDIRLKKPLICLLFYGCPVHNIQWWRKGHFVVRLSTLIWAWPFSARSPTYLRAFTWQAHLFFWLSVVPSEISPSAIQETWLKNIFPNEVVSRNPTDLYFWALCLCINLLNPSHGVCDYVED